MMVSVDFPLTAVLQRHLRQGSPAVVPEVHASSPATPAWTEEQRVHDGAGHELDNARRACLLAPRAAWTGGFSGCSAAPVGCSRGHRQRVHFLRQVVIAVGQLGEGLQGVLIGGARVVRLGGRSSRGRVVRRAGAVPQFDGWWMLGDGFCTTWAPSYSFWEHSLQSVINVWTQNSLLERKLEIDQHTAGNSTLDILHVARLIKNLNLNTKSFISLEPAGLYNSQCLPSRCASTKLNTALYLRPAVTEQRHIKHRRWHLD